MERATRYARIILIGIAVILGVLHCLRFRDFTVDDSGISYAYSQNFAHGQGLVGTAGGERVEGYSNFLWVVLVGAGVAVFGHVMIVGKVLGLLLAVVGLVGTAELSAALRRKRSALDALPTALCAVFLPVAYWSMSGLENPLFIALSIWACVRLLREAADPALRPWSALLVAGVALTRPDGLVFVAAAATARLFARHTARRLPLWMVYAALPIVLHIAWRYSYYAWPWPNTYYVKAAFPYPLRELFDLNSNGWKYVIAFGKRYQLTILLLMTPLALLHRNLWPRLTVLGCLAAVVFFPLYSRGDWMSEGRFVVGAMPFLFVLAVDGIENLARATHKLPGGPRTVLATGTVLSLLLCWSIVPKSIALSNARVGAYPVTVDMVAKRARRYHELATTLAIEHPATADGDAGGNLLYSGMRLLDIGWLNDVTLAHWGRNPGFVREYVFAERPPTFFLLLSFWLAAHLQDYPEFKDYVALPKDGAGHFIARSAFLSDTVDTRKPLARLTDAVDVLGFELDATTLTAWVLARRDAPEATLLLRAPGTETDLTPGDSLYPPSLWRAGEVITLRAPRPAGSNLNLCAQETCVAIAEGRSGATPVAVPRASDAEVSRLVDRHALEAAVEARLARGESADVLGQALYQRALTHLGRGETGAAFDDFQYALRAAPRLSFARRHIEELRVASRAGHHPVFAERLGAEVRKYHLAPTAGGLAAIVALARAAHDPLVAVRAHLAVNITPPRILPLAECYFDIGLPGKAAELLSQSTPADAFEMAAYHRIALAADRADLFTRWNTPSPPAAQAALASNGNVLLQVVRVKDGERVIETTELGPRPQKSTLTVGGVQISLEVQPFSADFEAGRVDGWTASGAAFEDQPHTQASQTVFGAQGNHFVRSKVSLEGTLTSPVLADDAVEICFIVAGSYHTQVFLDNNGQRSDAASSIGELAVPRCLKKPGPGAWRVVIEDRSTTGSIVFDDLTCFTAQGANIPCAGAATATILP